MATIATLGNGTFPAVIPPMSNVTPFTYRDGITYTELLYELRDYVLNTMSPEFAEAINSTIQSINDGLAQVESTITADETKWAADAQANIDALVAGYNAAVAEISNRVGPENIHRVTLTAAYTLTIDPAWPTAHPILFQFTQDTTGGWQVTLDPAIHGGIDVATAPGALTEITLIPNGDGTWHTYQPTGTLPTQTPDLTTVALVNKPTSLTAQALAAAYSKRGTIGYPVEDYLQTVDGTDWTPAFKRAFTAAAGAPVMVKSGKTYTLNTALSTLDQNINLVCLGSAPAILQTPGNDFDAVNFAATGSVTQKYLAAPMQFNTNGWVLNDATGVVPGMIAVVKSSASWYYDPRPTSSDARKSELHRVSAVSGTTVWFEDASNDGYSNATETVTIDFFNPISVYMENVTVKGVLQPYGPTTTAKTGIIITGAYEPILLNVDVADMAYTGICLVNSYRPSVIGGHTHRANAVPTGYGVQTRGTAHAWIFARTSWGCRRNVDFSGDNIISRNNLAEDCTTYGGGRQADGTYYGWGPNAAVGIQNYGFGSHGPADHSTYRNCRTANVQMPYELRGGDETIEGAKHTGRTRGGFINLLSGSGLTVRNVSVTGPGANKNTTIYDGGANINSRRADYFIRVNTSYDLVNSKIYLDNIDAEVQDRFISFDVNAVPASWLKLSNSRILFATSSGTDPCAVFWHDGALSTADLYRWTVGPLRYSRDGGTTAPTLTTNVNLAGAKVLDYGTSPATT